MSETDYRSSITSRPSFNRTVTTNSQNFGSPGSGNRVLKIVTEMTSSSMASGLSPYSQNAASTIRDARERERKEIMDLNDKLASYIERVRFLEAQNRKLAADFAFLTARSGKNTSSVKTMYELEISEASKVVKQTGKEKEEAEKEIRKLQDDLNNYRKKFEEATRGRTDDRKKIDDLLVELSTLEAEINLLKRRIALLEEEISRLKKENLRLTQELQRARTELDQETLNRIDYQNQVTTLLEEIDLRKRHHEEEIRELQAMAARDTTSENREYFKNELASAIRDIRNEYDQMMNGNRNELESWYKLRVQEIQTQSARQNKEHEFQKEDMKRLRTQISDLRGKINDLEGRNALLQKQIEELNYQQEDDNRAYEAALNDKDAQINKMREECQALMVELQMLLDAKQNLAAELAIYRNMLEGEEGGNGLRQLVEQVVRTTGINETADTETMRVVKGETSSRTSYQRSAKGNVSIQETSPEGKFIVLENTNRSKEEPLGDWKLKRKIDGKREIVFTFPSDFVLHPSKSVKIFARGNGIANPPDVLVFEGDDTFGVGANVQTILYNNRGEIPHKYSYREVILTDHMLYSNSQIVRRDEITCNVIVADDRKTVVYAVRLGNGPVTQKIFEEYEKFFQTVKTLLPDTVIAAPRKKFFQSDSKLYEKRRSYIGTICQHLIDNHSRNEEVRRFFHIEASEDDDNLVDLGPSEKKTACPQDFDFLTTIGKGSFGRVYQVRHKESGNIYAMKVLSKDHIRRKNEVKHVMAERNVLINNFKHPFLVSLHYSFQNKDKLYFVLDHLNGGELFSHLQKEKHFTEARSRFYAAEIACALGYLHEKNIIYRDLKPENLLLDDKGYLVLTDFGLCKEDMIGSKTTSTFCGTPEYLAPEIIMKKPYDKTVDWWCLGSVLYEMIFGLPPFYSKEHNEMYEKIVNQPLRMKHSISVPCSELITGLLQKDRSKRLGHKNDFKDIRDHPFFLPIDWNKLLNRELKAPFIPKIRNQMDTSNISKEFVELQINQSSLVPSQMAATHRDHDFPNFTFVDNARFNNL